MKYATKVYEDAGFNERSLANVLMDEIKLREAEKSKRKALLTLSLCWFYEKQGYGVSRDLFLELKNVITFIL